jgi:putative spermidine/putrescine transport system ATP-binding protein
MLKHAALPPVTRPCHQARLTLKQGTDDDAPAPDGWKSSMTAEALVQFRAVAKSYDGRTLAVRDLTLDVRKGEFLTLLGPSGSGKTTTLNMLAGFERPTRGEILIAGKAVDRLPPYQRNIGMVFQNYALFPHMTVAENVAFPLSVRGIGRAEQTSRVARALASVRLDSFATRRPGQLSGGQQQRVALARALVFEPSLVLLDEPLGALDKKLREHMQIEIKLLHEQLGITMVYVTHDQSEALTMSDRVAVFCDGAVVQHGPPDTLYRRPVDPFVAGFIGENNFFHGTAGEIADGKVRVALDGGIVLVATPGGAVTPGQRVVVAVRPEAIGLAGNGAENRCSAVVRSLIYLGDHQRLIGMLDNGAPITVKIALGAMSGGERAELGWAAADCLAFAADARTDETINKDWSQP